MEQGKHDQRRRPRPRVVMLCAREHVVALRVLLEGGNFTVAHVVPASPTELLLLQPDVVLACALSADEVRWLRHHLIPCVPLVICSLTHEESHVVTMLDAGADDVISAFCGKAEAQARLQRHRRRVYEERASSQNAQEYGGPVFALESRDKQVRLVLEERTVYLRKQGVHLSLTECAILFLLMREGDKVVRARTLLQTIWGTVYHTEVDYLRVYLRQLRQKIEGDPKHPQYLETVPTVGYRFTQSCMAQ